ncbi:MLO-like protein 1 [Curcuma longa]|uniref:MLO-like protein 1 n=1 Tax=Curcuma longa TaxID=136217 RepID=UPI003D9DE959
MAEGVEGFREGGGGENADTKLEFTPTWIVAGVCALIILVSLSAERYLHYLGMVLKHKNQKPLYNALQKVKEELMLLGFISLLLTVFQHAIQNLCIPKSWALHMLPCKRRKGHHRPGEGHHHVELSTEFLHAGRRFLAEELSHCALENKVPLLSLEAIHQLHIFIFVLAVTHVTFSAFTVLLGGAKIHEWKHWEETIQKEIVKDATKNDKQVHQFQFLLERVKSINKNSVAVTWLHSFIKQFYWTVTKSDYITLRFIFVKTHCSGNPKFDFHKYMIRAFESDFKQVVGTSWYLWLYVVIFLLFNVDGWHTYLWIAFVPLFLLLAVGTKLEHVITELAHSVADKYFSDGGDLVVVPSDEYFWFHSPRMLLYLIHFILFQNAYDVAFLFWLFIPDGFDACSMDHVSYAIPRLLIGVIIQLLCSYSTLPLYAIVTQMGTHFKQTVFDEHVRESLVTWAQKAKKQQSGRVNSQRADSSLELTESPRITETTRLAQLTETLMEEGKTS